MQTTNIGQFADDVAQEAVHVKSKTEQHRSIQHRPAIGQGTVVRIVVSFDFGSELFPVCSSHCGMVIVQQNEKMFKLFLGVIHEKYLYFHRA